MKTKIVIAAILLTGGFFTTTGQAQEIVYTPKYFISEKMPHEPLQTAVNPWAWPNVIQPDKKDIKSEMPNGMVHHPLNPQFKKKPKVKNM